jgi:hypothetical protein
MSSLDRVGDKIEVTIPRDADGYFSRECPVEDCLGYFKVTPGTGLAGEVPCHCPYCGHIGDNNTFWSTEQIEYAKSVAMREVTGAILHELRKHEFDFRPRAGFGIGLSLKVTGSPPPVRPISQERLETRLTCDNCGLKYAIYGVFGYCPDCGAHNSQQILEANLVLTEKQISLAASVDDELHAHLVADALENAVSAFDGFGREMCRVSGIAAVSFQHITKAQKRILDERGFDFAADLAADDWKLVVRCFHKRHLVAHKMCVVDQAYLDSTDDPHAVLGRKVVIDGSEVSRLLVFLRHIGRSLVAGFACTATAATDGDRSDRDPGPP